MLNIVLLEFYRYAGLTAVFKRQGKQVRRRVGMVVWLISAILEGDASDFDGIL